MLKDKFFNFRSRGGIKGFIRRLLKEKYIGKTYMQCGKGHDKEYFVDAKEKRVWILVGQPDGSPPFTLEPGIFDILKKEGCSMRNFVRDSEDPNIIYPSMA